MRCPACDASVAASTTVCRCGQGLVDDRGIVVLLPPDRRHRVEALEVAVSQWRATRKRVPVPAAALPELPGGEAVADDHEWRLRRYDLDVVTRLVGHRRAARILDVGAWNGWLSHRLAALGHRVTATDVFAGPGSLGAPWPVPVTWRRVQVDPTELDRLEETFDVVILDRCLQFFPDPAAAIRSARDLLAPEGMAVATGLMVFRDPRRVREEREAERDRFRRRSGRDLMLHPSKGYLDRADLAAIERAGLTTHPYPQLRLANVRARIHRSRPEHRYGVVGG